MQHVTLKNRVGVPLTGTWDSRQYVIPAEGLVNIPKDRAIKFCLQNPVMGSEDPRTGSIVYKLGIEEYANEFPVTVLDADEIKKFENPLGERWVRPNAERFESQPSRGGLYATEWRNGLSASGGFAPNSGSSNG